MKIKFLVTFFALALYMQLSLTMATIKTTPKQYMFNEQLRNAIQKNNLKDVIQALNNGAQVNVQYSGKETPLHLAVLFENSLDIIKLLLTYKANVNALDSYGKTPLDHAIEENNSTMVHTLLQYGADVNAQDTHGRTPLHFVAAQFAWEPRMRDTLLITGALLKHGAEVNILDKSKSTPLDTAFRHNKFYIVKRLLYSGAYLDLEKAYLPDNKEKLKSILNTTHFIQPINPDEQDQQTELNEPNAFLKLFNSDKLADQALKKIYLNYVNGSDRQSLIDIAHMQKLTHYFTDRFITELKKQQKTQTTKRLAKVQDRIQPGDHPFAPWTKEL